MSANNVFADLGYAPEEAENLRIRSDLMIQLSEMIRAEDLTQAQAAKRLGVTQPRVSNLMKGKVDKFSIDMLVNMHSAMGRSVSVVSKSRETVTA